MIKLNELKEKQIKCLKQAREIWDKQFSENRELTQEEYSEYKKIMSHADDLEEKIKEEERLQKLEDNLSGQNSAQELQKPQETEEFNSHEARHQQTQEDQEGIEYPKEASKEQIEAPKVEETKTQESQESQEDQKDQETQEEKNESKSNGHRDWIMGIDETKTDIKQEQTVEQKGPQGETGEVILDNKGSQDNNGRSKYSLLSRLNKQKEMSQGDEINTSEKTKKPQKSGPQKSGTQTSKPSSNGDSSEDPFRDLKNRLHRALIDEIDKEALQNSEDNKDLQEEVTETVKSLLEQENRSLSSKDREKILAEILNETLGFGPITPLIEDENITEIMVNGPGQVYVEEEGKLKLTDIKFRDDHHVLHVIEKIVAPLGRRIDESSPMVDARLPDGSRVNAIVPPLSLTGPTLTIRKFSEDPLEAKDLITFGTMSTEITDFLKTCVQNRMNIIVSGGTGSGKTTTLNVLSSFIPKSERIVTIEDAAELTLHQDHVVTLETRPPNMEGKGAITMRDLVRNSLRMRPDRIVVGEVRGGEALDMLQAMNTGHDGSLTTGHANSPRDMLSRLETMVLMAGMDLPVRAIREQISSAIDLIVQQDRLEDGSRKIVKISGVQGMEGDVITMQDLYTFEREGRDSQNKIVGEFKSTGFTSAFLEGTREV